MIIYYIILFLYIYIHICYDKQTLQIQAERSSYSASYPLLPWQEFRGYEERGAEESTSQGHDNNSQHVCMRILIHWTYHVNICYIYCTEGKQLTINTIRVFSGLVTSH